MQTAELVLDLGGLFHARREDWAAPIAMARQRRLIGSGRAGFTELYANAASPPS